MIWLLLASTQSRQIQAYNLPPLAFAEIVYILLDIYSYSTSQDYSMKLPTSCGGGSLEAAGYILAFSDTQFQALTVSEQQFTTFQKNYNDNLGADPH